MELRGLTALAAAVATGCLSSPPGAVGRDGGGDAGGDAGGCAGYKDDFGGDALGGLWDDPVRLGGSTIDVAAGVLDLIAAPDADTNGQIGITSLLEQPLEGSRIHGELTAFNDGAGTSGLGWYRAPDDLLSISHVAGAIRSLVVRPGSVEETVCAPCADYLDGQTVVAELREEDGMIQFSATVDGVVWDLGRTPAAGEGYRVTLAVSATDQPVELRLDQLSWTDCSSM